MSPLSAMRSLHGRPQSARPTHLAPTTLMQASTSHFQSQNRPPDSAVTLALLMFHARHNRHLARNTIFSAIPSAVSDIFRSTDVPSIKR